MNRRASLGATTLLLVLLPIFGQAQDIPLATEVIRNDIHLMVSDLIDDLVYDFKKKPPFRNRQSVLITLVSTPSEFNNVLETIATNRLYETLIQNPDTHIIPVYCQMCQDWLITSSQEKTVAAKGIAMPAQLALIAKKYQDHVGLSLHFSAEENTLALRAFLFRLTGDQSVIWGKKYVTSQSSPHLLRSASHLISVEEAREEYVNLLKGKSIFEAVFSINVRYFPTNNNSVNVPIVEFTQRLDGIQQPYRNRRIGFGINIYSAFNLYEGWGGHLQYETLLFRKSPSLIYPDFWFFVRFNYTRLRGPAAIIYAVDNLEEKFAIYQNKESIATITAWQTGVEIFSKNRIGMSIYAENSPSLWNHETLSYWAFSIGATIRW